MKVTFTRAAIDAAERTDGLPVVEDAVRGELSDLLLREGLDGITNLCFHTVCIGSYFDDTKPNFIVTPNDDGSVTVDLGVSEEIELTEGNFAGMTAIIPKPAGGGAA